MPGYEQVDKKIVLLLYAAILSGFIFEVLALS